MVKYYNDCFSVYKTDDDGRHYTYYKSSDEWREVFPNPSFQELTELSEDFWEEPNMTEKYLTHCKNLSTL